MKSALCVVAPLILLGCISTATAGCVGPTVMGECASGTVILGYGSDDGYRGQSGQTYDYDLNKPADRNRYSTDLDAQRRDQLQGSLSPNRSLDRIQGQQGGGYRSGNPLIDNLLPK